MRRAVGFLMAIITTSLLFAHHVGALSVSQSPPDRPAPPVLITGYRLQAGLPDFVQVYNNSSEIISLDGWQIVLDVSNDKTEMPPLKIALGSWILPHQYAVFAQAGVVEGADSEFALPDDMPVATLKGLSLVSEQYAPHTIDDGFSEATRYQMEKTEAGNYTPSRPFEAADDADPLYGGGLYLPADNTPLLVSEVLANARDCAPLERSADCREFVELYNPTDMPIETSPYRLRLGYGNASAGIANTVHLAGVVAPRSHMVVYSRDDGKPLDVTAAAGNIWLEDTEGLKTYQNTIVTYKDIGKRKGFSWARNGSAWQWANATPSTANNFAIPAASTADPSGLKPCKSGQYRSSETNRCRNLATAASGLKPCKAGQYRSSETNRCRNATAAASSLKPCAPNQTRNPATNRCRSMASSASQLKPCKPGQERNPETNRCRNVAAALGDTAFAVEPVKQTGKAFVGWWALGGVAVLAAGYAGWEWRHEVSAFITKTGEFFRPRK